MTISSTFGSFDLEPGLLHAGKQSPPVQAPEKEAVSEIKPKFEVAETERLKSVLAQSNISLNFRRDEASGQMVVELIDNATGDAVRQIPSEVSLKLSELFSKVQGKLFEARA